jgi:hypothetical protein
MDTLLEKSLAVTKSKTQSPLKSPTATDVGPSSVSKWLAVSNEAVPFPNSIDTLSEATLAVTKSRKFCSISTFSIVQVCGFPIVISPSHSSEKLVQINKLFPTVEPASYPLILHISGVIGSIPSSVTLYGPGSSSRFVPVDEPVKLI